jgi:hypothetical protein
VLTESHQIGVGRVSRDDGQKGDHLGNNVAAAAASSCISGSRWGGLGLGGVGGDSEEVNEGIHLYDCMWCVVDSCDGIVLMPEGSSILSFYTS